MEKLEKAFWKVRMKQKELIPREGKIFSNFFLLGVLR